MEMLIEGAILAILVVWVFLRDWRATLVSAIALPLSIIPTFWAIWALGFSLNILTLLALTLVVGILVDDAIVEVENIVRHLRTGKTPKEAAMDAAIEIGLAVVATTFTICRGVHPGRVHERHRRPVLPAVRFHRHGRCAVLVARRAHAHADDGGVFLEAARRARPRANHEVVPRARALVPREPLDDPRRRDLAIGGMLALFPLLPTGFSPAGDNGFTRLTVELAPGSSLEDTLAVSETVRQRLEAMPEVAQHLHGGRYAGRR